MTKKHKKQDSELLKEDSDNSDELKDSSVNQEELFSDPAMLLGEADSFSDSSNALFIIPSGMDSSLDLSGIAPGSTVLANSMDLAEDYTEFEDDLSVPPSKVENKTISSKVFESNTTNIEEDSSEDIVGGEVVSVVDSFSKEVLTWQEYFKSREMTYNLLQFFFDKFLFFKKKFAILLIFLLLGNLLGVGIHLFFSNNFFGSQFFYTESLFFSIAEDSSQLQGKDFLVASSQVLTSDIYNSWQQNTSWYAKDFGEGSFLQVLYQDFGNVFSFSWSSLWLMLPFFVGILWIFGQKFLQLRKNTLRHGYYLEYGVVLGVGCLLSWEAIGMKYEFLLPGSFLGWQDFGFFFLVLISGLGLVYLMNFLFSRGMSLVERFLTGVFWTGLLVAVVFSVLFFNSFGVLVVLTGILFLALFIDHFNEKAVIGNVFSPLVQLFFLTPIFLLFVHFYVASFQAEGYWFLGVGVLSILFLRVYRDCLKVAIKSFSLVVFPLAGLLLSGYLVVHLYLNPLLALIVGLGVWTLVGEYLLPRFKSGCYLLEKQGWGGLMPLLLSETSWRFVPEASPDKMVFLDTSDLVPVQKGYAKKLWADKPGYVVFDRSDWDLFLQDNFLSYERSFVRKNTVSYSLNALNDNDFKNIFLCRMQLFWNQYWLEVVQSYNYRSLVVFKNQYEEAIENIFIEFSKSLFPGRWTLKNLEYLERRMMSTVRIWDDFLRKDLVLDIKYS